MSILWLFDTCGWILGPAILLAGVAALGLCLWATCQFTLRRRTQRLAVSVSLLPLVLGICGALVGAVLWLSLAWPISTADGLQALGKVCLAGLVVSAVPLVWALLLLRLRRGVA
jgi:hypothetical protein